MSLDNTDIPSGALSPHRHVHYGSFHSTHTHSSHTHSSSPRATISDVLDLSKPTQNTHSNTNTDTDTDDTSNEHNLLIPPSNIASKSNKSIKVLSKSQTQLMSNYNTINNNNTNQNINIQNKLTNASLSSMNWSVSSTDIDSIHPDMSHHINDHGLIPIIHGTPHHGEAHQIHLGQSPIRRVIFNMLNSIIGAGVVGLPFVYSNAGLCGGLLLMILFAWISAYSLKLLVISAKLCQQRNYEDLCEYLFGYKGYLFVSVTMFVFDFGATLSYLIILGDSAQEIIRIWGYNSNTDRQFVILIVSLLIILPTILPRDLSKIEKVSTFSVFSVLLIMLIVIWEWIAYRVLMLEKDNGYKNHIPPNMKLGVELEGFPMAIGIIAFAFVCHDSSFLLYNTLKNPTIPRWSVLAYAGCISAVLICMLFAVPGYFTFGDDVNDNILNSYDTFNPLIIVARCIYCVTMALTYPCSFFVVRHVCYAIFHHGPNYKSILQAPLWKHLLFTIPIFLCNLVMGTLITDLGIVMSVSGSLSAVILAFVLPTMCYLKICQYKICFWKEKGLNRKWRAFKTTFPPAILWLFGVFVAIFSTSITIMQYYGANESKQ
eukprot:319186_1